MTNNFMRRFLQHNGILKGGAKYTTRRGQDWYPVCIIDGFETMKEACQCEWAIKHHKKKYGCHNRVLNLEHLWKRGHWTSKSPLIQNQDLRIYIDGPFQYPGNSWPHHHLYPDFFPHKDGIKFIEDLCGETHEIIKIYDHEGYLLLYPKE